MRAKLKLEYKDIPQNLEVGKTYEFRKKRLRWFHTGIEAYLEDKLGNRIALIKILNSEITFMDEIAEIVVGSTKGEYQVIKLYEN